MPLKTNTLFANRYQLVRLLGRGGFSEVWLAKDSYTRLEIAIKVYAPGSGMDTDGLVEFSQELAGVFNLNHTNLLKPTHVDAWEGMPYLILPFCSQGSIVKRVGKMSEEEVWKMMHDVASGLAYLHQHDIVHQDIKPDNILVDDNGNYLITDFGISTKARSTLRKSVAAGTVNAGTMAYMGPERFSKQPAPTRASDIWSFGAMVYELITGIPPFEERGGILQKNGAEIPDINEPVSDNLKQVVEQMMAMEKNDRPTAGQLVEIANTHVNALSPAEGRKTQRVKERQTQRIEPVVATPEKKEAPKEETLTEANNPNRNKRIIGWSIAAVLIVLVAVGAVWSLTHRHISSQPQIEIVDLAPSARILIKEHILIDNLYYNLYSDTTAEVTYEIWDNADNYKDLKGSITIPSAVQFESTAYAVTHIGFEAFRGCKGMTSVTLPNSIIGVEMDAFYGTGITQPVYNQHVFAYLPRSYSGAYTIPDGIEQIAGGAFSSCKGLTSVKLPNSVITIGEFAFAGCGITQPVYNQHVFAYLPRSYSGAYTIPDGIEQIGHDAFSDCYRLKSVNIPNSVTTIGNYAFAGCSGLKSVTLPNSVTRLGYDIFDASGITQPVYNDHVFVYMPRSYSGAYTMPEGIEQIAKGAFCNCTGLTSVTIPNSIISISAHAFWGCGITKPVYNDHVFAYMPNSYSGAYTIADGIEQIAGGAFSSCKGLTSVKLPNSLTTIGDEAFISCSGLKSVTLPDSVTSLGDNAFYGCSGLTTVTLSNSITRISNRAFCSCSKLKSITIPNSVTSIGYDAFNACTALTSITIPSSVTSIGYEAFCACSALTSVKIPKHTQIGDAAFKGCKQVEITRY